MVDPLISVVQLDRFAPAPVAPAARLQRLPEAHRLANLVAPGDPHVGGIVEQAGQELDRRKPEERGELIQRSLLGYLDYAGRARMAVAAWPDGSATAALRLEDLVGLDAQAETLATV